MEDALLSSLRCLGTLLLIAGITIVTNRHFPSGWNK